MMFEEWSNPGTVRFEDPRVDGVCLCWCEETTILQGGSDWRWKSRQMLSNSSNGIGLMPQEPSQLFSSLGNGFKIGRASVAPKNLTGRQEEGSKEKKCMHSHNIGIELAMSKSPTDIVIHGVDLVVGIANAEVVDPPQMGLKRARKQR
eukprot:scaffold5109_cov67-Cylindrotheca_fusiformis.AAC.1